nr:MAG TPA: hypothetical protein [Crassvirales sp.]
MQVKKIPIDSFDAIRISHSITEESVINSYKESIILLMTNINKFRLYHHPQNNL